MNTFTSTVHRFGAQLSSPLAGSAALSLRLKRLALLLNAGRIFHTGSSTRERLIIALLRPISSATPVIRRTEVDALLRIITQADGQAVGVTYTYLLARRSRYLMWMGGDGLLHVRNKKGEIHGMAPDLFLRDFGGYGFTDIVVQPLWPEFTVPAGGSPARALPTAAVPASPPALGGHPEPVPVSPPPAASPPPGTPVAPVANRTRFSVNRPQLRRLP